MLNIIEAIRKMCEPENGFVDLFKKESYNKLCDLTSDSRSLELFAKLFYGKARKNLIELIKDVYQYDIYAEKILFDLTSDGLTLTDAEDALSIFLKAFGFPKHRDAIFNPITEFVSYESGNFKTIHKGETLNNQEYGVGIRNNYYEGRSCGWDECVWINGRMIGYCYSLDVEFIAFETYKYGFVLNDSYIGKYMTIYEDGSKEYMDGYPFNVE